MNPRTHHTGRPTFAYRVGQVIGLVLVLMALALVATLVVALIVTTGRAVL